MLLDDNFVMQGGVRNYLGKTKEVKAPKYWKSSKDSPKTELAYITEAEKGLLIDANLHGSLKNGKPNVGAAGLLSYDGWGDSDRGTSDASYGGGNASGDGDNRDYGGSQEAQDRSNRANQLTQARKAAAVEQARQQKAAEEAELDRQKRVKEQELAAKEKAKKEQDDARLDYLTTEYLDVKLTPEQKKEFEQYRTGVREDINPSTKTSNKIVGGLLSSFLFPGAGKLYNSYLDATAMGYKLQNPFGDIFGGKGEISVEDVNNLRDGGDGDNARSQLVQNIAKIINPNLPDSQVNNYFKNIGSNSSGVSPAYMTTYNNAKNKISQSLNLTPNNQQFGYTANPYSNYSFTPGNTQPGLGNDYRDNYSMSMTSANPFFDELTNQGLI